MADSARLSYAFWLHQAVDLKYHEVENTFSNSRFGHGPLAMIFSDIHDIQYYIKQSIF